MNNKGMTLIELIITIAMLSVAMTFMYGLMTNLQRKKNDNDAYTDNLMKIVDIETGIQKSIMNDFDFGREEVTKVRVWNDLWFNGNDTNDHSKVTGHYIRLDVYMDGVWYEKSIGINDKGRTVRVRYKKNNAWVDDKIWKFDSEVQGININENCHRYIDSLFCQINLYLYDDNKKVLDTINIPLYFKTELLYTDTTNERKCRNNIDTNTSNCPDIFSETRDTSLPYSNTLSYSRQY